jgi:hypothetical protein
MDTRPRQIAAVFVLHRQANRGHCHQQAVSASGVNSHQTRQLATPNRTIAGHQVLQTAYTVNQALIWL